MGTVVFAVQGPEGSADFIYYIYYISRKCLTCLTCLKYFLDKKSKISQCAKDDKFIWCCIFSKFQFEMVVLKVFREFAGGTSIHGFNFLVRPKSSPWTKTIWAISLAVALMYATLEMRNSVVGKTD